jgi:hypothetical protein
MSGRIILTEQLASPQVQDGHFWRSTLSDYWALTKPEVNLLILIATGVGFYLGCGSEGRPLSFGGLVNTLMGTLLVASGTGTLNQYVERKFDAQMRRTARRPAAAGRLKPAAVLAFGIALASAGSVYLAVAVNPLSSVLAILTTLLSVCVHAAEAKNTDVRSCRSFSRRHAAAHWLCRGLRAIEYRGGDTVRHALSVAISTFHGNRMDVPRRLRPRRLFGSTEGQCENSFRDCGNAVAAPCSRRHQHHAITDTVRGDFLLCSGSSRSRIRLLRSAIRIRAFKNCCAPTAHGLDCLSSSVVRAKRDVLRSGQMIQIPDLPANSNKERFEQADHS